MRPRQKAIAQIDVFTIERGKRLAGTYPGETRNITRPIAGYEFDVPTAYE